MEELIEFCRETFGEISRSQRLCVHQWSTKNKRWQIWIKKEIRKTFCRRKDLLKYDSWAGKTSARNGLKYLLVYEKLSKIMITSSFWWHLPNLVLRTDKIQSPIVRKNPLRHFSQETNTRDTTWKQILFLLVVNPLPDLRLARLRWRKKPLI